MRKGSVPCAATTSVPRPQTLFTESSTAISRACFSCESGVKSEPCNPDRGAVCERITPAFVGHAHCGKNNGEIGSLALLVGDARLPHDLQRAVGRFGQQLQACFVTLGLILAVAVGEEVAMHLTTDRPFAAQFLGAHRGELGDDRVQLLQRMDLVRKGAREGDLLLAGRHMFETDALHPL